MPQPQIRDLLPDDLSRISDIESLIAGHPRMGFLEKRFKAVAADPKRFITCVALDQGDLVGYAFVRIQEGEFGATEVVAVLDVIGVNPEVQGHGIGKTLLGAIAHQLAERQVGILKTQVAWADRRMVQFFSSEGFRLAPSQIIERDTSALEERTGEFDAGTGDRPGHDHGHVHDGVHDLSRDRVQVRSLKAEDLAEVVRIDHKLTGRERTAYYSAKFQEMLTESGIRVSLVSEEDGVLTGFVMARVDFGEFGQVEKTAVIDAIGVHPALKGSGIGHALLSQLLLNLSTLQVECVLTQVSPEDFNLHRFLHACGFVQTQRLVLWTAVRAAPGAGSTELAASHAGAVS